jgi:hypothetical protein
MMKVCGGFCFETVVGRASEHHTRQVSSFFFDIFVEIKLLSQSEAKTL